MQLKKHNSKTRPEERPKWLRRGIALLAAIATLATGGVVASTAYAEGDTGGGGKAGGGPTGGGTGSFNLMWNYGDRGKGFGPSSDWNSTKAAITNGANGFRGLGWSVGANGDAWIKEATQEADTNCEARVQKVYPGAPKSCRVVGVGVIGSGAQFGYPGGATHNIWMDYWNSAIAGANHANSYDNGAGYNYRTDTLFPKDPNLSIDKIADTYAPDFANGRSTGTIVVLALSRYEPAPMAFTPTISTEAPHIIQEGQPITDRVTVGVKSGDHWIDGTSVTAKGYYFTGSKDAIIRNLPYNGDPTDAGINNYLNQIRSAGGEYPWVTGMGARYGLNRAESGPWVRDGDKNDSRGRAKEGTAASRACARPGRREAAGTPLRAFAYRR